MTDERQNLKALATVYAVEGSKVFSQYPEGVARVGNDLYILTLTTVPRNADNVSCSEAAYEAYKKIVRLWCPEFEILGLTPRIHLDVYRDLRGGEYKWLRVFFLSAIRFGTVELVGDADRGVIGCTVVTDWTAFIIESSRNDEGNFKRLLLKQMERAGSILRHEPWEYIEVTHTTLQL